MSSTVRSAKGASPRSVSQSSGRRSKYASRSACCLASSPVSSRRSSPGGGSVERDPELIHLPVERRQREAERLRRLTLVVAEPPQERLDVDLLVRPERVAQIVGYRRERRVALAQVARKVGQSDPLAVPEDHRVLDDVVELAHVSLPGLRDEELQRRVVDATIG